MLALYFPVQDHFHSKVVSPSKRRVSVACGGCKKAKCRCSGPPAPCRNCQRKSKECIFQAGLDGRRKDSAETALMDVQAKHQALKQLFDCLRSSNDAVVDSVVEAIRKGSTLSEIGCLMEELIGENIEPGIGKHLGESSAGPIRRP